MLRYFVQQFFFQILIGAAVVAFVGIFIFAIATEGANPPPRDVKDQFQNSLGKAISDGGKIDLSVQHMSSNEVAEKLNEIIADALSFTPTNYQTNVNAMARYFTAPAYEQYKGYLTQSGFFQNLKAQNLRAGAYTEQPPLEINSLVQNGVYKWLFEAPVTVSFTPLGATTYEGGQTTAQNQRFTLRVQLTRVQDAADPNAIKIEIWQMLPPRG